MRIFPVLLTINLISGNMNWGELPMSSKISQRKAERKSRLLRTLSQNGSLSVDDLAAKLGISSSTLRRELHDLIESGVVSLHAGIAELVTTSETEFPFHARRLMNQEEKKRIAAAALELIQNGEVIFMAGGTTTLELARLLPGQRRLTVITNVLHIANLLVDQPNINLVTLGGIVRPYEQTMHGLLTEVGIQQLRADKFFYGVQAISLQHGITHSQLQEVSTDRALAAAATKTVVLADHTKFDRLAPALVLPLEKVHVIVTGQETASDFVDPLREMGINVIAA
jgi:DeoR/GlpR family transcriptional regulator of sugar metabolism